MRFVLLTTLVVLLGVSACGASQESPHYPGASEGTGGEQTLPRYFSVTVFRDGLQAVGQDTSDEGLRALAVREASDPGLRGAAVTVEAGVSERRAIQVVEWLVQAGFKHIVFSSREGLLLDGRPPGVEVAPTTTQAADIGGESSVGLVEPGTALIPQEATGQGVSPETTVDSATPPAANNVEVKQMGLHVGGGPNDEATHARYASPIQRRFADLQACYPLAQGAGKNASFGVDLLIGTQGGKAKIKDYRTVLGGKDFHLCVLGVFGGIDFPAPEKATVISYSVLFKPL